MGTCALLLERRRSIALSLQRHAELLDEGLAVGGGGTVAGLADLGEAGATLMVDDPLARHAIAEGNGAARDRTRDERHLVDRDRHVARIIIRPHSSP